MVDVTCCGINPGKTMFVRPVCGPGHELADGYAPAFCGGHAPEPASH